MIQVHQFLVSLSSRVLFPYFFQPAKVRDNWKSIIYFQVELSQCYILQSELFVSDHLIQFLIDTNIFFNLKAQYLTYMRESVSNFTNKQLSSTTF